MIWKFCSRTERALIIASVLSVATIGGSSAVHAANVTPDVIFGSGNANGSFTVDTENHVELGLRAKQRFPAANIFNYDGVDTYTFQTGSGSPGRPLWNFEWSINTNVDGLSGLNLSNLTFKLSFDTDPSLTDNFTVTFDPINGGNPGYLGDVSWDHAIGNNSTGNGGGTSIGTDDPLAYANLISTNNVAQNSWAFNWYAPINPNANGVYGIKLAAFNGQTQLASTEIHVVATPVPPSLILMVSGLAVLGIASRWKAKAVPTA